MRSRTTVVLGVFVVLVFVIALLVIIFRRSPSTDAEQKGDKTATTSVVTQRQRTEDLASEVAEEEKGQFEEYIEQLAEAQERESGEAVGPEEKKRFRLMLHRMKAEQVPILFYGRVVDENDEGVPRATVHVSYSYFNLLRPDDLFTESKKFTVLSDAQGSFSVSPGDGYALSIPKVEKEGYFTSEQNPKGWNYVGDPKQNFRPDASNPVIFRLRKKAVSEPLIYHSRSYRIPRDGTPVSIDLLAGRTNSAVADLRIRAWTDEASKDASYRYDWRVRFEAVDGGIQESHEEFDFLAPEEGYESVYEMDYLRSRGEDWRRDVAKTFFIRSREGLVYGRIGFRMIAGGDHFCLIEAWLNPSGSRNLEPDPNLLFPNLDAYNRALAKQKQAGK